jgi:hypothetical protein
MWLWTTLLHPDDLSKIFKEMEAIGSLFPTRCKSKMLDIHVKWRKEYGRFWFKKWSNMNVVDK